MIPKCGPRTRVWPADKPQKRKPGGPRAQGATPAPPHALSPAEVGASLPRPVPWPGAIPPTHRACCLCGSTVSTARSLGRPLSRSGSGGEGRTAEQAKRPGSRPRGRASPPPPVGWWQHVGYFSFRCSSPKYNPKQADSLQRRSPNQPAVPSTGPGAAVGLACQVTNTAVPASPKASSVLCGSGRRCGQACQRGAALPATFQEGTRGEATVSAPVTNPEGLGASD